MRTFIIALMYLIIGPITLPFLLLELLIRKINEMAAARFAQAIVRIVFGMVLFVSGAKKTVIGRDRVPLDGPVLYAANHRSFYDIFLAYLTLPTQTAFVSKKEISKLIIVAQWMHFLNCLFIDREDLKQQMGVILGCIENVKKGYSIFISPEGTRNATDELLPFKEGSLRIAHKTGCPVIPVCILGTEEIFESHLPWVKKGKIIIEYGEPIYLDQLAPEDKKHLGAYVQKIVATMYEKNLPKLN